MSADNYTQCPRCRENLVKQADELAKEVVHKYGIISMEEWTELQREAKRLKSDVLNGSEDHYEFREDYETYLDSDGWVQISYRGSCSQCGLSYRFEHSEKVVW